ncbi:flagellar hook-associated protein FlgK [Paenisporosarcina sp. TG-14]|uniref:flagellar hook-associated protein FlgK n=1 Tax=Paenisporosarcina sp. TG-14 TaxID=1231057 RepID=UPI000374B53D|nr:flagellar hook-associated protein FlgK [Paenisporosarcina sp. TG-14]
MSTFHGLEVGKRGLMVGQASIATTGHNIANANTQGYSRQQVNATTSPSLTVWTNGVNPGQLGTGVTLESITRVRDSFLDQRYREQAGNVGEWSVKQQSLDHLELIINEPSDTGLNSAMNQIWGAWQDVANDPANLSAQAVLKERAQAFVDTAKLMDNSMTSLKKDLGNELTAKTEEANSYLTQIADLNKSILRSGPNANDLLDQRDVLVEKLSSLVTVNVEPQTNGVYNISLSSDGTSLVSGEKSTKLDEQSTITGGELAGIVKSLAIVDKYQDSLNETVKNFAIANGMSPEGEAGENLFIGEENNFSIAALTVNTGVNQFTPPPNMDADSQIVKKSFQAIVSQLGAESQSAIRNVTNHEAALQATENRRQSVTGVSLDEEMANLIKYQHSYNAAARLISTADQMLDTIINRMAAR